MSEPIVRVEGSSQPRPVLLSTSNGSLVEDFDPAGWPPLDEPKMEPKPEG